MITPKHFIAAAQSVALTPSGRKSLLRAYEQRMDNLATHPLFGYRVSQLSANPGDPGAPAGAGGGPAISSRSPRTRPTGAW
jgi:CRISPR/Cas system-associated endonuclease Cas1